MFDEPFAHGRGLIHRLDPRARLVAALALGVAAALLQRLETSAVAVALATALLAAAAPPPAALLRRLLAVAGFFLMLWLTVPWTVPGPPALSWGPLTLSWPGIHLAAMATLKGLAIVLATTALVASMTMATLGHALLALGIPNRLVWLLFFTYRHIFGLLDAWSRLWDAARLRGFVPRSNGHTYRTLATLVGLVIVRALDQAQRTREAMLLRGFSGRLASVTPLRATCWDWAAALALALASIALLVADALRS